MMTNFRLAILITSTLCVAACGGTPEEQKVNQADEFAARIKGAPAPAATESETQGQTEAAPEAQNEPPVAVSANGPVVPGTASDPNASICGAPAVAPFMGRQADDAIRAQVVAAVGSQNEVRFILPGSTFINPDPTSSRLNVMIDNTGVIRDARCG